MGEKKIETIGLAQAGPVTPAKPVEKPISKEEQKIKDLEAALSSSETKLAETLSKVDDLDADLHAVGTQLKAAQSEAADRRGAYKVQKAEADALKVKLAADPNLAELAALRAEVSTLHTTVNRKEALVQEALTLNDTFLRRAKEQEQKNAAILATLSTMQVARDAAQARESAAYQKVAILERDLEAAKRDAHEARKDDEESCSRLKAIHGAHQVGHPAPVAACKICVALGRVAQPSAADPAVSSVQS